MMKKLEWDSKFFGFNIANLDCNKIGSDNIENFCKKEDIYMVQSCCNIAEVNEINFLEKMGFHFVDLRINYGLSLSGEAALEESYQAAKKEDEEILQNIAAEIFKESRYFHNRFDLEKVRSMYKLWIKKAIAGKFDDVCIKVSDKGVPVGFITGKDIGKRKARIGLIGVDQKYQRMGYGKVLLSHLISFYQKKGIESLEVSTQGKNIKANNFYQNSGFKSISFDSWYYKFIDEK